MCPFKYKGVVRHPLVVEIEFIRGESTGTWVPTQGSVIRLLMIPYQSPISSNDNAYKLLHKYNNGQVLAIVGSTPQMAYGREVQPNTLW